MYTQNKIYPFQDHSLKNIAGEKWKPLPGHEFYYSISNFGRVRREEFEIICANGRQRLISSKIMSAELGAHRNKSVRDKVFSLRVKIYREGIHYQYSIARLVYYCFKKKFDMGDHRVVVLPADGDGRNVMPQNLMLVDISKKQQRIFDRKRIKRKYNYSINEFRAGSVTSSNANCKQVSQYAMNGKKIKTFPSIKAAAMHLKINETGIHASLKERQVSSGGYVWRYGKASKISLRLFIEARKIKRKKLVGTKLSQYSSSGKRIATYLTIADAAQKTGIKSPDISSALNGKQKSAGGFIWKKGWGKQKINLTNYLFGEALRSRRLSKKIRQYSQGKYIKTFPSIKAAAEATGVHSTAIIYALKNKMRSSGGYKWDYF